MNVHTGTENLFVPLRIETNYVLEFPSTLRMERETIDRLSDLGFTRNLGFVNYTITSGFPHIARVCKDRNVCYGLGLEVDGVRIFFYPTDRQSYTDLNMYKRDPEALRKLIGNTDYVKIMPLAESRVFAIKRLLAGSPKHVYLGLDKNFMEMNEQQWELIDEG